MSKIDICPDYRTSYAKHRKAINTTVMCVLRYQLKPMKKWKGKMEEFFMVAKIWKEASSQCVQELHMAAF